MAYITAKMKKKCSLDDDDGADPKQLGWMKQRKRRNNEVAPMKPSGALAVISFLSFINCINSHFSRSVNSLGSIPVDESPINHTSKDQARPT